MFYFTLKIIYKDSRVSKIFLEKLFKFELSNEIDGQVSCFILDTPATNCILQERGCKENMV